MPQDIWTYNKILKKHGYQYWKGRWHDTWKSVSANYQRHEGKSDQFFKKMCFVSLLFVHLSVIFTVKKIYSQQSKTLKNLNFKGFLFRTKTQLKKYFDPFWAWKGISFFKENFHLFTSRKTLKVDFYWTQTLLLISNTTHIA